MKIYVQGSEVEPAEILLSLEEKEAFGIDIFSFLGQDDIVASARDGRIEFSEKHGPSPPYNIEVHVSSGTRHVTAGPLFATSARFSGIAFDVCKHVLTHNRHRRPSYFVGESAIVRPLCPSVCACNPHCDASASLSQPEFCNSSNALV